MGCTFAGRESNPLDRNERLQLKARARIATGADGSASRWTLWAAADLQRARGGTEVSGFDGAWRFVYLGLDGVVDERWLGGVAVEGTGSLAGVDSGLRAVGV